MKRTEVEKALDICVASLVPLLHVTSTAPDYLNAFLEQYHNGELSVDLPHILKTLGPNIKFFQAIKTNTNELNIQSLPDHLLENPQLATILCKHSETLRTTWTALSNKIIQDERSNVYSTLIKTLIPSYLCPKSRGMITLPDDMDARRELHMNRFRELKMYETLNSVANIYQETKNIPITQHTLEQPRAWEPGIFGAIQERVYSVVSSVRASLFS